MAGGGIEVCPGRKWNASRELQVAEERLRAIFGTVQKERGGLGVFFPTNRVDESSYKSKQRLIQDEVRKGEDEISLTKLVGLKQQGAWNSIMQRKIKWCKI